MLLKYRRFWKINKVNKPWIVQWFSKDGRPLNFTNTRVPLAPLNSPQWRYRTSFTQTRTVADPDFELRRGPGSILLAQPAFLLSVISTFFIQKIGGGGRGRELFTDMFERNNLYDLLVIVLVLISFVCCFL